MSDDFRDFRCSAASLADDEPMAGTAPVDEALLFVEYSGAWGRNAPELLDDYAEIPSNVRPQLIRRHKGRSGGARVFVAWRPAGGGDFVVETTELGSLEELATLDLDALAERRSPGLTAYDDVLWLVCSNGRRDRCCAVIGRPVVGELTACWPEQTWETTHLGGHRFAGTLLALPSGQTLGRLAADNAVSACEVVAAGGEPTAYSRGRAGLPGMLQVALLEARRGTPDERPGATVLGVEDLDDGGLLVHVEHEEGKRAFEVHAGPGEPRRQSCGDTKTKPAPVYTVTER